MKIISYGHVKPKIKTCEGCGAVYEYLPKDIETMRAGTSSARNYIRCPVCGHSSWVYDVIIKHDTYSIFQNVDRANTKKISVDGNFVNAKTNEDCEFKSLVFIGFDGQPLGDSMLKMVEDSVAAVIRKELSDAIIPIETIPFKGIEMKAMMLTNLAMSKLTTRANVKYVKIRSVSRAGQEVTNDRSSAEE